VERALGLGIGLSPGLPLGFARLELETAKAPFEWLGGPIPFRKESVTESTPIATLVYMANLRWRIEEDYEDLKQEVGLADFEGRTWQGFHHHASLCIAARTFLVAERSRLSPPYPRNRL
jgi:SRSO17 transposase